MCLTETWIKPNEYIALNEASPPGYSYVHQPRSTGRGGVGLIHSKNLVVTQKPKHKFNSFEILYTSISYVATKNKSIPLIIIYRPPGPYTEFLSEFADFVSNLVVSVDKALIVGDFNIHFDNLEDPLRIAVVSILDSVGINQNVIGPTHNGGHTLDLILTYGLSIENIIIFPQSEVVSDHYLISFIIRIDHNISTSSRYRVKRTYTSATAASFINNLAETSIRFGSPSDHTELDQATESLKSTLHYTLDRVAPLKRKIIREKKLAPWCNDQTRTLKQTTRQLERKWRQTKLVIFQTAWKESLLKYRKSLGDARKIYFSTLIGDNKNNSRFLFNTVAKLTRNKTTTERNTQSLHSSEDFMKFFNDKVENIRREIQAIKLKPDSTVTNPLHDNIAISDQCLECFAPLRETELATLISSANSSTCILDPVPTCLFKQIGP
ncbi:uncharacterized protein LOC108267429 isoform X1 [Ictalurus punctatus]|uniref:Uncharacterized protein LOC108267429 isoform X1 n=1 Tax=Ictalurus punctatus TaxID=7998 RepID=A0A9F7QY39_ICTPU|nr:uncharacterized protein LOC108267429 isoform X1 [Ictalurus punctatus]